MSKMGHGYGSECHLLRWMGRHRALFDQRVLSAVSASGTPAGRIEWLDFGFDPKAMWPDAELKGLEFLPTTSPLQQQWRAFWPQGRGIHNWDAVGWLHEHPDADGQPEILLIEAKAHLGELQSNCGATGKNSIAKIEAAFRQTKAALGVAPNHDWMKGYYQFTNRVAALHFLVSNSQPARLLFIYFVGDLTGRNRQSPQSENEWRNALRQQDQHVGLPKGHRLAGRIHALFLPVSK